MTFAVCWCLVSLLVTQSNLVHSADQPNIVLIVADDLGWGDVGWNNPVMLDVTPTLTQLARSGVILSQYYVQQVCSPSRAALLTGIYPFHLGRQKGTIKPLQPTGLTLTKQIIADKLSRLGYETHAVGKWHLGFCKWKYTPTHRGFHSFYGYYTGAEHYFSHLRDNFFDFRSNASVEYCAKGQYSTDLFTERAEGIIKEHTNKSPLFLYLAYQATHAPLEAPAAEYRKLKPGTANPEREVYRAMLARLDSGVGAVVRALKKTGKWENTVLVFTTDNGGAVSMAGSNHPLRGTKGTLFEGGTRGAAFLAGGAVRGKGESSTELVHITDWFPTLLSLAGGATVPGLDGLDQSAIVRKRRGRSARMDLVYNLKVIPVQGAIRVGDYKLMFANKFVKDGWYDPDAKLRRQTNTRPKRMIDIMANNVKMLYNKQKKNRENKKNKNETDENTLEVITNRGQQMMHAKNITDRVKQKVYLRKGKRKARRMLRNERKKKSIHSRHWNIVKNSKMVKVKDVRRIGQKYKIKPCASGEYGIDNDWSDKARNVTEASPVAIFKQHWPRLKKHLFNVRTDPEERKYLVTEKPEIVEKLRKKVVKLLQTFVPRDYPAPDPKGRPTHFNNVWSPGWC